MDLKDYPILCVDDDEPNRVVIEYSLGREFRLLFAESGKQALDILSKETVAVLLTDQRMPEMTGVDLAETTYKRYPDVIRIIITAYSDLDSTIDAINRGRVSRFIKKPWTGEELAAVVRESIFVYGNNQRVKEMQEQLLRMDRVATLGVIASSIVHDFNQPICGLAQGVDLLKMDIRDLHNRTQNQVDARSAETMMEVVGDMERGLDMMRVLTTSVLNQVRSKSPVNEVININEIVQGVAALMRHSVLKCAYLDIDLPDEEIKLAGSTSRLSQLLANLMLNAVQAIEPGTPGQNNISLKVVPKPDHCLIQVQDTGQGISPENQENIFTPFFTTKGSKGSGIGLAICKQVVEEHNGTIQVSSTQGTGTRFDITIPYDNSLTQSQA